MLSKVSGMGSHAAHAVCIHVGALHVIVVVMNWW
jgi:hypothetical protein